VDQPGIGFFGGSFDPPHQGHLQIAEQAIETANLEKLIFCPAFHAPMKDSPPMFSGKQRLAMLKAMCAKNPLMQITDIEIVHAKTRYTYETIFELRQNFPNHLIYLILGADQFVQLHLWKQIKDLAKMVTFLVFARDKDECALPKLSDIKVTFARNSLIDLSSTFIRHQLASGTLADDALPPEVVSYIKQHHLFPTR
jgi:nicotinate-nucleotide adenylyltransferase